MHIYSSGISAQLQQQEVERGFLDRFFDRFTGFAGALLYPAKQFVALAFGILEIVIRELGPLLLQLAFGDVPVAFDFECRLIIVPDSLFFVSIRRQRDGKSVLALVLPNKATPKACSGIWGVTLPCVIMRCSPSKVGAADGTGIPKGDDR